MKLLTHLGENTKNEIIAILLFALAIILCLSLITNLAGLPWMGKLGGVISGSMFYIFGLMICVPSLYVTLRV